MNEQKRFFLFMMISFLTMFGLQIAMEQAGFFPKPQEKAKTASESLKKDEDNSLATTGDKDSVKAPVQSKTEESKTVPAPEVAV